MYNRIHLGWLLQQGMKLSVSNNICNIVYIQTYIHTHMYIDTTIALHSVTMSVEPESTTPTYRMARNIGGNNIISSFFQYF